MAGYLGVHVHALTMMYMNILKCSLDLITHPESSFLLGSEEHLRAFGLMPNHHRISARSHRAHCLWMWALWTIKSLGWKHVEPLLEIGLGMSPLDIQVQDLGSLRFKFLNDLGDHYQVCSHDAPESDGPLTLRGRGQVTIWSSDPNPHERQHGIQVRLLNCDQERLEYESLLSHEAS